MTLEIFSKAHLMDYYSIEPPTWGNNKYYRVGAFYVLFSLVPSITRNHLRHSRYSTSICQRKESMNTYWFFRILILLIQPLRRGLDYMTLRFLL